MTCEEGRWCTDVMTLLFEHYDAVFKARKDGDFKKFTRRLTAMSIAIASKTKQVNKPKTCQHCNCWNGTTCTNCRSPKWTFCTGAGCTCDWWEGRKNAF